MHPGAVTRTPAARRSLSAAGRHGPARRRRAARRRAQDNSLLQMPPWSNPWLLAAMALSFGLHCVILYVPALAAIFSIVPLSANEWALVLLFAAPVCLIDEVLKLVGRRYVNRRGLPIQGLSRVSNPNSGPPAPGGQRWGRARGGSWQGDCVCHATSPKACGAHEALDGPPRIPGRASSALAGLRSVQTPCSHASEQLHHNVTCWSREAC